MRVGLRPRHLARVLAGLLLLPLLATRADAADPGAFPWPLSEHRLPNGLRIVIVPRPGTGMLAYYTLIRAGSRNEVDPGRTGYAHLFEHLLFRGTPDWPRARYDSVLRRHGASDNAYTTSDATVFTIVGPAGALDDLVTMEADRFSRHAMDLEGYRAETRAVLGEFHRDRGDPDELLDEALLAAAYPTHPYGHPVIGLEADIRAMDSGFQHARAFFHRYYAPDNAVVVIVGDVDPARTLALVSNAYEVWKGKATLPKVPRDPPPAAPRERTMDWPRPTQARLRVSWMLPGVSAQTARQAAAADVLAELVFGDTSDLYDTLVRRERVVESLWASANHHRDPRLFTVGVTMVEGADPADAQRAIMATLDVVRDSPPDDARVTAVVSHLRYSALSSLETVDGIADFLCDQWQVSADRRWMDAYLAELGRVTGADVQELARGQLDPQRRVVVRLQGPREMP